MKCYLYKYNDPNDILCLDDDNRTLVMTIYCDDKDYEALRKWTVHQGLADKNNYHLEKVRHFVSVPGGRFSGLIEVTD